MTPKQTIQQMQNEIEARKFNILYEDDRELLIEAEAKLSGYLLALKSELEFLENLKVTNGEWVHDSVNDIRIYERIAEIEEVLK